MKIALRVVLLLGAFWTFPAEAAQRGGPPARIVTFEARPASIQRGESTVLVWHTENPSGAITIEPGVGRVTARGTTEVTPLATTTYTLTVGELSETLTVTVPGTTPETADSVAPEPVVEPDPRLSDGEPDLSGVYNFAGLPRGTEPPPLAAGGERFRIVRGPNDVRGRTTLNTDCVPLGVPQSYITPYPFQIVQRPGLLVMIFEYPNAIRMIPTDDRPLPVEPDPKWMGSSVGHWEGDTLVVESIGFNDKTEVHGFLHTDSLHVVERFTRTESGALEYEVTVEDPNVWTTPWVIPSRTFPLRPELEWVEEFVCESNVDYERYFGN